MDHGEEPLYVEAFVADAKKFLTSEIGKGTSGQDHVPWHEELKMPADASRRDSSVKKGNYERHGLTCLARSDTPEVARGAHVGSILISAGEFNALRLIFAIMAASLLYRGAADLYQFMFGIGYGPF